MLALGPLAKAHGVRREYVVGIRHLIIPWLEKSQDVLVRRLAKPPPSTRTDTGAPDLSTAAPPHARGVARSRSCRSRHPSPVSPSKQAGGGFRVAISDQHLDPIAEERRVLVVAVEQRHLMAACQRVLHLVWSEEARASENQDVEGMTCTGDVRKQSRRGRYCNGCGARASISRRVLLLSFPTRELLPTARVRPHPGHSSMPVYNRSVPFGEALIQH